MKKEKPMFDFNYCQIFFAILFYLTCYAGPLFVLPYYMVPAE
jgi:hypothetical protein